jgi:hypothetical protein
MTPLAEGVLAQVTKYINTTYQEKKIMGITVEFCPINPKSIKSRTYCTKSCISFEV